MKVVSEQTCKRGYATPETAQLVDWVTAVGVEVVAWVEGEQSTDEIFSAPSSFRSQPFTLAWNVQTLALSHGISRLSDLAHFLGLPRQGLYGVWRGTAVNVSVARLERLAKRLGAGPDQPLRVGDWYRWDSKGRLVWGIKEVAEQIGLDAAQLAFAASQYPQQIALFWEDKAKLVFVDTLARLAAALETKERPFDIGEMFVKVWDW